MRGQPRRPATAAGWSRSPRGSSSTASSRTRGRRSSRSWRRPTPGSGTTRWPPAATPPAGPVGGPDQGRRPVGEQGVGRPSSAGPSRSGSAGCTARREQTSTRAAGSDAANAFATRSPLRAPWQPMNPTCVRCSRRRQAQVVDQRDVEARGREPGARHGDQVRDLGRQRAGLGQGLGARPQGQGRGLGLVDRPSAAGWSGPSRRARRSAGTANPETRVPFRMSSTTGRPRHM